MGLKWDADNWSCAYDSLFVILYNIWELKPDRWTRRFKMIQNKYLSDLIDGFIKVSTKEKSFEVVRDEIRNQLNDFNATLFPTGRRGASVASLAIEMFKTDKILASSRLVCMNCDYYNDAEIENRSGYILQPRVDQTGSTNKWILELHKRTSLTCPECSEKMEQPISYYQAPKILILEYPQYNIATSHVIRIKDHNENDTELYLRGIVYHGGYHFTSRIIEEDGKIWYHDGAIARNVNEDGFLKSKTDIELRNHKEKELIMAIYAQK
jgi:hypothetical protein